MPEYEMPVEEQLKILVKKFSAFEGTLDTFHERFDRVEVRLDKIEGRLDRIEIRLDETQATAKMGLEAVDALRDSMNQKFAAMDKKQNQDIDLLKTVVVHVRKRVDAAESSRRRRS